MQRHRDRLQLDTEDTKAVHAVHGLAAASSSNFKPVPFLPITDVSYSPT